MFPERGRGRTTEQREQWQIQRLLRALLHSGALCGPVHLEKGGSPDFVLTTCGRSRGIEATEAVNPDYVRATMHPNARDEDSLVDPSLIQSEEQSIVRSRRLLMRLVELNSPGMAGRETASKGNPRRPYQTWSTGRASSCEHATTASTTTAC